VQERKLLEPLLRANNNNQLGEIMIKNRFATVVMILLALFALGHTAERLVLAEFFTSAN
jgi:hypothetical protein